MSTRNPWAGILLALLCMLSAPWAASAAVTPGIEVDGNYVDDDPDDPYEDWHPSHPPMSDPPSNTDDTLCGTKPAPKNDITNTFAANNNEYLFTAMERRANTGTTSFFWKFDVGRDGNNPGDFIFVFCFASGGGVRDTYVLEYDEATGEFVRDDTPPSVDFVVNQDREFAPFGALDRHEAIRPFIDRGKFAETSILLEDIEGFDICDAAAVALEIDTRSSCSLSSQCKDTTGLIDFSFYPLTASLDVTQPEPCQPVLMATANAADGEPPYTYQWFLDGIDITDQDPSWSTSDTIVIPVVDECGTTEVSVIVDDGVCVAEDDGTVNVNQPPVAGPAVLDIGTCDLTLAYDGGASTDCNADDTIVYAWDFDGDTVPDSSDMAGTWVYPTCGESLVTLVVADDDACLSEPAQQAIYANEPPVAGLQIDGGDCLDIDYASTTVDCDLAQTSALYTESLETLLDFGDGNTTTDERGNHAYAVCATYDLLLTATDASGCTDQVGRTVTIETTFDIQ